MQRKFLQILAKTTRVISGDLAAGLGHSVLEPVATYICSWILGRLEGFS